MADVTFTPEEVQKMIMDTVSEHVRGKPLDALYEATKTAAAKNLDIAKAEELVTAEKQLVIANAMPSGTIRSATNSARYAELRRIIVTHPHVEFVQLKTMVMTKNTFDKKLRAVKPLLDSIGPHILFHRNGDFKTSNFLGQVVTSYADALEQVITNLRW